MSSVSVGAFAAGAVPLARRIPAISVRTGADCAGDSNPATWCAWLMAESRRTRVDTLRVALSSVKYKTTVSGAAGKLGTARREHQARKSRQSAE
jgi:hypothetical protein